MYRNWRLEGNTNEAALCILVYFWFIFTSLGFFCTLENYYTFWRFLHVNSNFIHQENLFKISWHYSFDNNIFTDYPFRFEVCANIAGFHCHTINNKDGNHSINLVKNLRFDRWLIYKQPRQDLGLYGFSYLSYSEKYSFHPHLKSFVRGRHVGVPRRGTNMAAVK
jgi:hypothetical protein